MTKRILIISIGCLLLFFGIMIYLDMNVSCVKMTISDDVPRFILEKLNETDLQRGAYVFTNNFTGEDTYLVICGGEEFKNGYDAKVNKIIASDDWRTKIEVEIEEYNTDSSPIYCHDKSNPYVIFKIEDKLKYSEQFMMYYISISTDQGLEIPVINWWGNEEREKQEKYFSYKIVDNREDIEEEVWNRLETLDFKNHQYIYVLSPRLHSDSSYPPYEVFYYDIENLYLIICPGKIEGDNYRIAIENILFSRNGHLKDIHFTLSYREYFDNKGSGFVNDLGYPFEVVKISSSAFKEKKQRVSDLIMDVIIGLKRGHVIDNDTTYVGVPKINVTPYEINRPK